MVRHMDLVRLQDNESTFRRDVGRFYIEIYKSGGSSDPHLVSTVSEWVESASGQRTLENRFHATMNNRGLLYELETEAQVEAFLVKNPQ